MKILGTGLNGLIGTRIVTLLQNKYTFENISRAEGVDIRNIQAVLSTIEKSNADFVLHVAAKTDVDGCEKEKTLGEESEAWQINVEGTRNVAAACEALRKKLFFVSTDFVFDGTRECYTEEDTPHPINWYATTKYEGEKTIQKLTTPMAILRLSFPYRAQFEKKDFVRTIKQRLEDNQPVMAISDQIFTPTFIDDIAIALDSLIENHAEGIYHVVGSEPLTPYNAAVRICDIFGLDKKLVKTTTAGEFFQERASRPFRLALKNDKISALGVKMHSFTEGLEEIKHQLSK